MLILKDLQPGVKITHNKELLKLLEGDDLIIPYVNDDQIDRFTQVFGKQRWLVEVLPSNKFEFAYKTHRVIHFEYCKYHEMITSDDDSNHSNSEALGSYKISNDNSISEDIRDNFNNIY